ncbi:MAG: hypothetical protein KGI54_10760 [Pseudomonadota bacterium]|nr:hypothetical protein [Pseudomonadota bacterium]
MPDPHVKIEPICDPATGFRQLCDALNFLDRRQIPLEWLDWISAIDDLGNLDLNQSVSLHIALDLISSVKTGTLGRVDLEQIYIQTLQAHQALMESLPQRDPKMRQS